MGVYKILRRNQVKRPTLRSALVFMGILLLYLFVAAVFMASLASPWIGASAYYLISIWSPNGIWPWIFDNSYALSIVAAGTMIGAMLSFSKTKEFRNRIFYGQGRTLLVIWLWVHLSSIFGSYAELNSPSEHLVLQTLNTILLMFFVSLLVIREHIHIKALFLIYCLITIYYIYWANMQYFSGEMWARSLTGRLTGPAGPYKDENIFAMLFVTGIPFIYFLALCLPKKLNWARWGMIGLIPFAWHALFLIGSRGALIAVSVVVLYIAFTSNSKVALGIILATFLGSIIVQGGALLERTSTTVEKSKEEDDKPLDPRLISWKAGVEMIADYPLFGVGVQRFRMASPDYTEEKARVAHNTFIQFSANSGLITGLMFLLLFFRVYKQGNRDVIKYIWQKGITSSVIHNSTRVSLLGFFFCSIFLDLMIYEVFYFLLLINYLNYEFLIKQNNKEVTD